MEHPLVLLVSRSSVRSQIYRETLERHRISCLTASSLKEVPALAYGTALSGILLDMPVMVKASPNDKAALEDVVKALPSVYLNLAATHNDIRVMTINGLQGIANSIHEFAALCTEFLPRRVLPKTRSPLHLHCLMQPARESAVPHQRTATLNVSPSGCFLFSVDPPAQPGDLIVLRFIGLDDLTPVTALISWQNPWGTTGKNAPGIGVKFEQLSESQSHQISRMLQALQTEAGL